MRDDMERYVRELAGFISECEHLARRLRSNSDDEGTVESLANDLKDRANNANNSLRNIRSALKL